MTRVLYISTFQFSGSTLVSFLLNTHSQITTVGHTTGWDFTPDEDFRCSCGESLDACPFYRAIAAAYAHSGLPFDIRNFGTAYRIVGHDRLNQVLTSGIPYCHSTAIELFRDRVVRTIPGLAGSLKRCHQANLVFMRTALEYSDAKVFVDNSHDPYRFRHLASVDGLQIQNMHLIRDPRGVVLSCRRNSNWDIELSMRLWLNRHSAILRIAGESADTATVYYEDLCSKTNETLAQIHRFVDVDSQDFSGDFRAREHHILGNDMRLSASNIKLDQRWQRELSGSDQAKVFDIARNYAARDPHSPMSAILQHYFRDL